VGARGEQREKWGGGGQLGAARRKENGRARGAQVQHDSMDRGVEMAPGGAIGGGLANRGGRRGTGDAVRHG
jgi:hypothetical protein